MPRHLAFLTKFKIPQNLLFLGIGSALLLSLMGFFVWIFTADARHWMKLDPEFVVARDQWQVLFSQQTTPPEFAQWQNNSRTLRDPQTTKAFQEDRNNLVWLQATLPKAVAAQAASKHANYFLLGWLTGESMIWANGQLLEHIADTNNSPIVVVIPPAILSSGQNLKIQISINPRIHTPSIVGFTMGLKEGLATYEVASSFRNFFDYIDKVKPMVLFFIYSMFAALFFLLWMTSTQQREYFHLSLFAILSAATEIIFANTFNTVHVHGNLAFSIFYILLFAKAASGLALGLSFSRFRKHGAVWTPISILILGVLFTWLTPSPQLTQWRQSLNQTMIPLVFLVGALGCLWQWYQLQNSPLLKRPTIKRRSRLLSFSGVLAMMGGVYFYEYSANLDYVSKHLLWGAPDLLMVMLLGLFALFDYRQQNKIIEKIPISQYHRLDPLPTCLTGAVVVIDLKNSEKIFKLSGKTAESDQVMPQVLSHIWTSIHQSQGSILRAEGDEVIAFFDAEKIANPIESAFLAMDLLAKNLESVSAEIRSQLNFSESIELKFRAAVALGQIRPIWINGGGQRLPSWNQVRDSLPFVDAARILDIEKQIDSKIMGSGSRVLIHSSAFEKHSLDYAKLRGHFIYQEKRFLGKHDQVHLVHVYSSETASEPRVRLVA